MAKSGNSLPAICFSVARRSGKYLGLLLCAIAGGSTLTAESDMRFIDRQHGDGSSRKLPDLGDSKGIQEAVMNGYLPYGSTGPAPRSGGIRGWQADILRGES
jgi:hypothetical protein